MSGRRRGNPRWSSGNCVVDAPTGPTRFELEAARLGLTEREIPGSRQMFDWSRRHANNYYVPEVLLKFWGITVRDDELSLSPSEFHGVAV